MKLTSVNALAVTTVVGLAKAASRQPYNGLRYVICLFMSCEDCGVLAQSLRQALRWQKA